MIVLLIENVVEIIFKYFLLLLFLVVKYYIEFFYI